MPPALTEEELNGLISKIDERLAVWDAYREAAGPTMSPSPDIDLLYQSRRALSRAEGMVMVPREPTREMLNAAVDVDPFKLGDISPIGFRCSPQQLFERCYKAMLAASPEAGGRG